MSSTINLLPCPFCNNAEIAINNENPKDNSGGYFIECPGCGASTSLRFACGDDPTSLLAEQWNRRATSHCLHQIQEPAAAEQAAWHAGLDEGRAQAAQAMEVDDQMALTFHHAITDAAIGQDDLNEIKIGLRAVLANVHAPRAQADALDALAFEQRMSDLQHGDALDAARYRWLRSRDLETISQGGVFAGMTPQNVILNEDDLDQAVDAAIAAAKGE